MAGGGRRGGVGGVRPAGTAPQADAFDEHAGTVAPGAEASDACGAGLPGRPVVPASGDGAVDGDERGGLLVLVLQWLDERRKELLPAHINKLSRPAPLQAGRGCPVFVSGHHSRPAG